MNFTFELIPTTNGHELCVEREYKSNEVSVYIDRRKASFTLEEVAQLRRALRDAAAPKEWQ